MKTWQKSLIMTAVTLAIGGGYLFNVWRHRQDPGVVGRNAEKLQAKQDDVVIVRRLNPTSFEDVLALQGKSVWMKNGNTISYFPYSGGQIGFTHPAGTIPPLQRLDIRKVVKSPVPASVDDGISHGSRQAFAVFSMPGSAALFAVPIGAMQGSQEAYFCDTLFYYDDPHSIYSQWPQQTWAAIDQHQVKPGMSELQTRLSIGQDRKVDGQNEGDRTVTYNYAGKQWTVTYVGDHATKIGTN